ncbi:MAG: FAD-dependent oxidoreductase [Micavibrio sp.]
MHRNDRESVSVWHAMSEERRMIFPPLRNNISVDVCVVGAGIAGLTTAYLLQKEGKDVAVIEAWELGAGETGRTTAHLSAVLDHRYYNLEKVFGTDAARLVVSSHRAAIDRIERIIREEDISCDFERLDGYLTALSPDQEDDLRAEIEVCQRVGFENLEISSRVSIPHIATGPAMKFSNQATFNAAKYSLGLARTFQVSGGQIFTGSRVVEINDGKTPHAITEDGYRIDAKSIVVATHTPVNDRVKMHTKQAAYRTYVIALKIPKDVYPAFLLWDMADPYHYARIVRGNAAEDYLVVGGADHKTGQADDAPYRYRKLEEWSRQHFAVTGPVAYRWSGQIMESVDYLAFIGRNPGDKNIYIVTGDSGNGMTHATIAGMLITDQIQGRVNPWEDLYDPARKTILSAATYIKENANVVGNMVSDWVAPSEAARIEDIRAGEGAIMRRGISKIAVHRDEAGVVHQCSAVCTHLGCVVQWNGAEKSWDCPCHGSRFDVSGHILNGPAVKGLEEVEEIEAGKGRRDLHQFGDVSRDI